MIDEEGWPRRASLYSMFFPSVPSHSHPSAVCFSLCDENILAVGEFESCICGVCGVHSSYTHSHYAHSL